ncbi:putative quinol monooxygenase [Planctomicrobium piriforme]|uniref:Quinol monooxygenase YgiN n=1 Tax=Planctomicrobium piriforme TaxID=1576369 RepID=A0A1I3ARY2_9PLAN|nr:antibiotic biosynthesis monooxygenase family protein [Planctomicrobium piriforme]SFH52868.1 Quinol monooxygenase YgiN [Planctomicrobium piriforme]
MYAVNVILTAKNADDVPRLAELLREQGWLSRAEPGCLQFDVCHSQNDASVFLLIERWETKQSWEVHRTAIAYTTIYQPQVLPLVDRVPHVSELLT